MLHARRAEREKAAGALRLRAASQARTANLVDTLSAAESAEPDATATTVEESTLVGTEAEAMAKETSIATSQEPTNPAQTTASATTAPEDPSKATTASTAPPPAPTAPDSISATPGLDHVSDLDFDSMFADTSVPDPSTNLDLDFDFSTSDNTFADLTSGNDFTVTNGNALVNGTSNMSGLGNGDMGGDIDSLMPGIESYVNAQVSAGGADDIFASLNLPPTEPDAGTAIGDPIGGGQQKVQKTQGIDFGPPDVNGTTQADVDAMMGGTEEGQMESNLDDLFFDESMGMEDGADMGNGEFGDMIDDWFKNA